MEDWEYSHYTCPRCGGQLATRDCEDCGGEGYNDDLYEEDPLWYDENEFEKCSHCKGDGIFFWCPNENCHPTDKEITDSINEQAKNDIWE
jgi:DnaJ-class molecular chaperone